MDTKKGLVALKCISTQMGVGFPGGAKTTTKDVGNKLTVGKVYYDCSSNVVDPNYYRVRDDNGSAGMVYPQYMFKVVEQDKATFEDQVRLLWDERRHFLVLHDPAPETMTMRILHGYISIMVNGLLKVDASQIQNSGEMTEDDYYTVVAVMEKWYNTIYRKSFPNDAETLYAKALQIFLQEVNAEAVKTCAVA